MNHGATIIDSVGRLIPLAGLALFLTLNVFVRSWVQSRRYGSSGVALLHPADLMQWSQAVGMLLVVAVLIVEAVAAAWWPHALSLVPALFNDHTAAALRPMGALLLVVGIVAVFLAQLEMRASWRVGIDQEARPGLVTGGLYRFCRNPIYLFGSLELIGFVLLLPNWLTLALAVAMAIGVRHGVSLEENYLMNAYGDAYRAYARRVGRFVPGLGRLSY